VAGYLLDTGLVLRHLRGQRRVVSWLSGLGSIGRLSIATVTRLEVHAGMRPEERYATDRLLSRFQTFDMDREVADRAGDLMRTAALRSDSLAVPDAIVAATAIGHDLTLVTLNMADFEGIAGLRLAHLPDEIA
jgi:predicted nucleic acid-binding protein